MSQSSSAQVSLSPETVAGVKASLPKFLEASNQIVLKFYETLFTNYPMMKRQFNMDRHKGGKSQIAGIPAQVASLANFVIRFGKSIDKLDAFGPQIERVAHKHVSRAVRPDQYDAIAESFLYAMKFILKDDANETVMQAWEQVFKFLAKTFIDTEASIKKELSQAAGFSGFADMIVTKVVSLDNGDKGIHLVPKDYPVPKYGEGQYVTICLQNLQGEDMMCTCKLNPTKEDCLCVTVRQSEEDASLFLLQRAVLGSTLQVSMPCGKAK